METPKQAGWCEALYDAKAPELLLYGRALGLSHCESEDVLHEVFIGLVKRESAPEQPEHYCVRAFRNRALNYRRSLWRRLTREWESRSWFEPAENENPEAAQAMRMLSHLPTEQREVIVLKVWHKYTFEQIGTLLEISPNTVAGRYRYGLKKLKAFLKGACDERVDRIGDAIALMETAPTIGPT